MNGVEYFISISLGSIVVSPLTDIIDVKRNQFTTINGAAPIGDFEFSINNGVYQTMNFDGGRWYIGSEIAPGQGGAFQWQGPSFKIDVRDSGNTANVFTIIDAVFTPYLTSCWYTKTGQLQPYVSFESVDQSPEPILRVAYVGFAGLPEFSNDDGATWTLPPGNFVEYKNDPNPDYVAFFNVRFGWGLIINNPTCISFQWRMHVLSGGVDPPPPPPGSGSILVMSKMNGLRFGVDLSNTSNNLYLTRCDASFPGYFRTPYFQTYLAQDIIPCQFKTDMNDTDVTVELLNENNVAFQVIPIAFKFSINGISYYNFGVNLNAAPKYCRVRVTGVGATKTVIWLSEWIQVGDELKQTNLVRYYWDRTQFKFDTYWPDFQPFFRVESHFQKRLPATEKVTYRDCGEVITLKQARLNKKYELQAYRIPGFMVESLNNAFAVDQSYINDVRYTSNDGINISGYPPRYEFANASVLVDEYGWLQKFGDTIPPPIDPPPPDPPDTNYWIAGPDADDFTIVDSDGLGLGLVE